MESMILETGLKIRGPRADKGTMANHTQQYFPVRATSLAQCAVWFANAVDLARSLAFDPGDGRLVDKGRLQTMVRSARYWRREMDDVRYRSVSVPSDTAHE